MEPDGSALVHEAELIWGGLDTGSTKLGEPLGNPEGKSLCEGRNLSPPLNLMNCPLALV